MHTTYKQLVIFIIILTINGCVTSPKYQIANERPQEWASALVSPALENCHRLSDKLIRCAQPTKEGFAALEEIGVKTIINLRQFHSDEDKVKGTNLKLIEFPLATMAVSKDEVKEILEIIKQQTGPVVVHCWHGADRTGTVSAAYRISEQNWSNDKALEEMLYGGYGYHSIFSNLETLVEEYQPVTAE